MWLKVCFERKKNEHVKVMGNYVFYSNDDERVGEALDFYKNHDRENGGE
jgi:hypothetical protein